MILSVFGFMIRFGVDIVFCRFGIVGIRRMVTDTAETFGIVGFRDIFIINRRREIQRKIPTRDKIQVLSAESNPVRQQIRGVARPEDLNLHFEETEIQTRMCVHRIEKVNR